MVGYLRVFLYILRAAAVLGLLVSSIINLIVVLDLLGMHFGYPWWTILITAPTALFF
jgi:hypothetical protein